MEIRVHVRLRFSEKRGLIHWEGGVLKTILWVRRRGDRKKVKRKIRKGGRKFDEDYSRRSSHEEARAPPTPLLRPCKSSPFFLPSSRIRFSKDSAPISENLRRFFPCYWMQLFLAKLRFPLEERFFRRIRRI